MEYINGGELFDKIASSDNNVLTEKLAHEYMKKLLGAICHMHSQGIMHRDIKPENIMLTSDNELKFIDFGLAKRFVKNKELKTIAGTPHYIAPEVIEGHYTDKCDMWSLGVILYVMMCGYLPFDGRSQSRVFSKISAGKYNLNHNEFNECSKEVMDLITKLLEKDPQKRLSAEQAL